MTRLTSLNVALFFIAVLVGGTNYAQDADSNAANGSRSGSRLHPITRPRITNRVQPASAVMPARGYMASQAGVINGDEVIFDDAPENVVADEVMIGDEDAEYVEGDYFDEGYPVTTGTFGAYSPRRRLCICLPLNGWVHAEYLLWWQNGMNLPPLVSTSPTGTARAAAGVLPGATVLYGGDDSALNGSLNGGRIRFGHWFQCYPSWGLEGEYFGLGRQTESFFRQSAGDPILARPFFNIATGREDAELVAFPNVLSGSVGVDVMSQFQGAAARLRHNIYSSEGCGRSWLTGGGVPVGSRLDVTAGYRYYELTESLDIREQLTSLVNANPGTFDIKDHFDTRNQFNGGEIGVLWQGRRGLWSLDGSMRVGIGNNRETVTIRGSTATTENNVTTNYTTGIYTQRTNIGAIGSYDRDRFCMIPELGLTLGYQFTRRLRLTTGYNLIYWGSVVRPGDQVDRDINPNLFAPEANPLTGPLRPQFQFVSSDYWVQGLSFGAEYRW